MPEQGVPLATALHRMTRQIKNASWLRISLKQNEDLPSPEKLSAIVRMMNSLPHTKVLVDNPSKQRSALLLSPAPSWTSGSQPDIEPPDTNTVYLVYNSALPADGKTASERMADAQQEQLTLIARIPPERRPNPAQLGLRVLQNLPATDRDAALRALGEAGRAAWQKTDPDVRNEIIRQFIKTVQSSPPLKPDAGANPETGATAPRDFMHALQDIVDTLAKRYRVRILIDPDLTVPAPPTHPSREIPPAQALDVLTESVPGVSWRSVYQRPPSADSVALSARSLASVARKLEKAPWIFLHFEIPESDRSAMLQTDFPPTALQAKLTAYALAPRPTYILYAVQGEAKSFLPVEQRLARMQMGQMQDLLNLNSSQMSQAVTDALAEYSAATADSQSQIMRLPIMALLMAVWFPQKAKEDGASAPPPF